MKKGDLVSATLLASYAKEQLQANFQLLGDHLPGLRYDVDNYRIEYITNGLQGELLHASGLLSIPHTEDDNDIARPLLSYHHGTRFLKQDVPSLADFKEFGLLFAAQGFVVSMPDYLGYGASASMLHPYLHAESLASASIDMLIASKQFLQQQGIGLNHQLFLAGYSEGGYATLAVHKALQENYQDQLPVTLSLPGAGPYDLYTTGLEFTHRAELASPSTIAFLLKAYDQIYQLELLDHAVNDPWLEIVHNHLLGEHPGEVIDEALPAQPEALFKQPFLEQFRTGNEKVLSPRLRENSIHAWRPQAPVHFYHGDDDWIVPHCNMRIALDSMSALGAENVQGTLCEGMNDATDHAQCAIPYALFAMRQLLAASGKL